MSSASARAAVSKTSIKSTPSISTAAVGDGHIVEECESPHETSRTVSSPRRLRGTPTGHPPAVARLAVAPRLDRLAISRAAPCSRFQPTIPRARRQLRSKICTIADLARPGGVPCQPAARGLEAYRGCRARGTRQAGVERARRRGQHEGDLRAVAGARGAGRRGGHGIPVPTNHHRAPLVSTVGQDASPDGSGRLRPADFGQDARLRHLPVPAALASAQVAGCPSAVALVSGTEAATRWGGGTQGRARIPWCRVRGQRGNRWTDGRVRQRPGRWVMKGATS